MRQVPGDMPRKLGKADLTVEYSEILPEEVTNLEEANVVLSLLEGTGPEPRHAPVIDIDIPHVYVPSSTPGHGHLYLDINMSNRAFWVLMEALVNAGVVEQGYLNASRARGYASVRLPWVKKESAA
jgi:hypothetical protein